MSSSCPKSSWVLSLCCPVVLQSCCPIVILVGGHICAARCCCCCCMSAVVFGCLLFCVVVVPCLFVCRACQLLLVYAASSFLFFVSSCALCPVSCVLSCVLCSNLIAVGTAHMSHSARERLSLRSGVGLGTGIGLAVDCGRDRLDFQSKCSAREQFLPPRPCRTFFPRPLYWAFLILVNKILSNF